MIANHPQFLEAIAERKKLKIKFYSNADSGVIDRIFAPMDYGPGGGPHDGLNRYWLWDCGIPPGPQPLGLTSQQIVEVQVLGEQFQPEDLGAVPWSWRVPRTWGRQSQTTIQQ